MFPRVSRTLLACASFSLCSATFAQATAQPETKPNTLSVGGATSIAAVPAELPRPTNAALFYWRAWDIQPDTLVATVDAEFNGRDLEWTPSESVAKALADAQGFIKTLVRATTFPDCDFGLEYTLGRDMDLSHLTRLRDAARILVSDARRLQAEQKMDECVERVSALYSLATHARNDQLTHSSATAQGFARMASDEVRRLMAANALGAAQKETLKVAADRLSGNDPFRFADAIRREGAVTYHYLTARYSGATAGKALITAISVGGEPEEVVTPVLEMNATALKAAAERARGYYLQVADAWSKADALESLRALEQKILGLEFGPVAFLVCPGLSPAYESSGAQLQLIREARAMLDIDTPPSGVPPIGSPTIGPVQGPAAPPAAPTPK